MMRVLVFSLFIGAALAAPQGYNYQLNYAPNFSGALTYPQVQLLQKFAAKQQQSVVEQHTVTFSEPQAPVQSQNIAPVGGSQFANQLIQLASYGQQQTQGFSQPIQQPIPSVEQQALHQVLVQPVQVQSPQPAQQQTQTFAQPQIQAEPQPQVLAQSQPQPKPQPLPLPQLQPHSQIQQQVLPQSQPQPQLVPQVQAIAQLQPQPQLLQQPLPQLSLQPQQQQSVQYSATPQPLPQPPQPVQIQHASPLPRAPEPTYYNKEYYYLSAPQENYELPPDFNNLLSKMKKNLRVVFIKAPEQNGLTKAALQLLKDSQQPKTAIYVLTKQHSAAELAKQLQQQPGPAQKPEVIFIKYRTRQEAEHAQRTIQSQYESLNGPNHFNFESVVPTQNFIGSTAVIEPRQRPAEQSVVTSATTPSPLDYLPPAQ